MLVTQLLLQPLFKYFLQKKKLKYLFEVYHLIIFSCKCSVYVKFQMSPKKES